MNELNKSTSNKYTSAIVGLITCLIDGHDDLPEEHDSLILHEFIGKFCWFLLFKG